MARPPSDIAPRLVDAAAERFLREGVDGASLRAIAREAGTSIGMLYYYFPTKDDLFLAVVEDVYEGVLDDLTRILDPARDPATRLHDLYQRFAAMTDAEFRVLRIMIREALVSSQRLARLIERFLRGHVPLILATVRDGIAAGLLDPEIPLPGLVLSTAALATMPQLVRRVIAAEAPQLAPLFPEPAALAETTLAVLMHGARPAKP